MREVFHRFLRPETIDTVLQTAGRPLENQLDEDYHLLRSVGLHPTDQKIVNLWFFSEKRKSGEKPSRLSVIADSLVETDQQERPQSAFARLERPVLALLRAELLLTCLSELRSD